MEKILKQLGSPGKYHFIVATLLAITWWSVALGNVAMTFYGRTPSYSCNIPGVGNLSYELKLNSSPQTPYTEMESSIRRQRRNVPIADITIAEDQCTYTVTHVDNSSSSYKCSSWTYNDTADNGKLNTIATEWNMVCDEKYKISLSSTMFFLGVFFGAFVFGFISDHLGRKKTLAICLYTQMPISLAVAFMPNFISFTIMRFVLGIWLQGISTVAFVHCIEFFRQKYRGVVMVGFGISWAFGQALTAMLAYLLPNWRHMQMVAAGVALVTVPYYWWLPESPRWLLVKGRVNEIVNVFVTRAAKINNIYRPDFIVQARTELECVLEQQQTNKDQHSQSFISILRTPKLLARLMVMCYLWFASSMAYYVFILNIRDLAGNVYFNFVISAALEIVVNFVIIYIMVKFGRKRPLIAICLLVAVLCIIAGTVPNKDAVTAVSLLGKMAMAAILCLIFVYAAELFPTYARGSCMALCGCSLRVGGMVAPQVLFLKESSSYLPNIIMAVAIFLPALLVIPMPETLGMQMPNTLEEAINLLPQAPKESKSEELLKINDSSNSSEDGTISNNSKLASENKC